MKQMKVIRFIETVEGNDKYKEFLLKDFNVDMLFPINDKTSIPIFEGWRGKNMEVWCKLTNDDGVILEVFPVTYTVIFKSGLKYVLPLPKTINDFINDMIRLGVNLFWSEWMYDNFEPKEFLHPDDIVQYYTKLLKKMDKSNELI